MIDATPSTITDAYRILSDAHGKSYPLRSIDELRSAIHANELEYGIDDDKWERFFDMVFDSDQGREWLYADVSQYFVPLI